MTRKELTPNKLYNSPCNPLLITQNRAVDVFTPANFEPSLEEIIHALPQINRYNGHTIFPYSVAYHSLLCADVAIDFYNIHHSHLLLYILLHDASEAYTQDMVRPIKRFAPDSLLIAEQEIFENLIRLLPFSDEQREDLKHPEFIEIMNEIDTMMAVTEIEQLLPTHQNPISGFKPYDIKIYNVEVESIRSLFDGHIHYFMDKLK